MIVRILVHDDAARPRDRRVISRDYPAVVVEAAIYCSRFGARNIVRPDSMRGMPTRREKIEAPTGGTNDNANTRSIDSEPPIALDKFIEQSGCSAVTVWRYRRAGWLNTLNICGRHYLTRSEIARFNARAAAGEFAKRPSQPKRIASR